MKKILFLLLLAVLSWSAKLTEVESMVTPTVYQQDVLINKAVICTSAVFSVRTMKTAMVQVIDCDSCKVFVQGSSNGSTFVNITDSIVAAGFTNIAESVLAPNIRVILARRKSSDTVTVWVFGKSY